MFAIYRSDRTGQPWTAVEDAKLHDDCRWGASSVDVLARRLHRPVAEVEQRMRDLGLTLKPPGPHSRKVAGS
jgi:hypothetical protein